MNETATLIEARPGGMRAQRFPGSNPTAPPVLMLHGLSLSGALFEPLIAALRQKGDTRDLYAVTLRGHGGIPAGDRGLAYADHAAELGELLAALPLVRPPHLVGFSFGGGVSLRFCLDHPQRVASLTHLAGALEGYRFSDAWRAMFKAMFKRVMADPRPETFLEAWGDTALMAAIRHDPAIAATVREMILGADPAILFASPDGPGSGPFSADRLADLRVPTLLLTGAEDVADFHAIADRIQATVAGVERHVIAGGTHLVPLEQPEALADHLTPFWRRVEGTPAEDALVPSDTAPLVPTP